MRCEVLLRGKICDGILIGIADNRAAVNILDQDGQVVGETQFISVHAIYRAWRGKLREADS